MAELSPNVNLSHYRIVSKIGAGGMGEVYLAQDTKLDRKVALKILTAELASNSDRMGRFVREAKSAAALNHPNIAHIYEIGESDGTHFIAMEFIDGETLRKKIHEERVPLSKLLKYLNHVAEGLSKAHAAGIVHRDLKPENIMITRDDYAKVLDFGLAKLVEPQRSFGPSDSGSSEIATALMQQRSTPGMVMGTVGYMSPEQASGRVNEIDHRSDIFSFGCILFEAATGQRAFEGKDALDSLHKIVHAPTPQLKDTNPLAPEELQRIVRRCLAKEPEKRYQSIKEVAIELDDLQQELKGLTETVYSDHAVSSSVTTSGATRADEGFWVAVLPFKARDTDTAVAVLADGLSEEIVAGLSRFRYLSVVASASAVNLKGETGDERALGAKLGARYVLEGSIRKGGSGIRVSAQLVDTQTGAQLWAETYNRDLETSSLFAVQDDVAARIVATVADSYGVLVHSMSDAIRQKDDTYLTPAEWQFQYFAYREQITPANHAALKSRLERAAKSDNRPSDLWACLAQIYLDEYAFGFPGDDETSLDRALVAARRAVELDRANQFAMVALAQTHFFRQDLSAFGPAAERAMALNPLNTDALGILGLEIVHTGEFERGTAIVRRAMELNPNHAGWMHFAPLWDHFHKGEYEKALECANRVDVPGLFWPFLVMASACGHLGRRAQAEAAVRDLLALDPEFAVHARSNVGTWHFASGLMEPILEGLRKAGLEISDEKEAGAAPPAPPVSPASSDASGTTRADEGFWVAVLPFKSSGTNLEVNSLAEGLSEEIVTGLSRFSYLRVIARSSTLRYAGESRDVRAIGKEVGARYVMEGSIRQVGATVRLAVQLVDTTTGANLWAETFDRQFQPDQNFALQDELVPRIVSTCGDHFGVLARSISDAVRGKDSSLLSPYEALMRGFGYHYRLNLGEHAEARKILENAVKQAPNNADCWAMLSWTYSHEYGHNFNPQPGSLDRALAAARRAVDLAPSNHLAYQTLAVALFFRKDKAGCLSAAERAMALNPLDASNEAIFLITFMDDWERGCSLIRQAMELNPYLPGWYRVVLALNEYRKANYQAAVSETIKANVEGAWADTVLAAAYGQLGEHAAARDAVQRLNADKADFAESPRELLAKWLDQEFVEHLIDGLRKAGLEIPDKRQERSEFSLQAVPSATEDKLKLELSTPSIAVLPFANISNDSDNEYFCDGLAEELLNALSKIEEMKVAARTSAFSFKGKNVNISEIGRILGINTVLEGSVRKSGDRIRITVQLINAADGYHLWSERYDRKMKDIFDVQDEITVAVVKALKVKLLGEEQGAVLKRHTRNPEAHEFYLRGLFYFNRFTPDDFQKASESFRRAIAIDPRYASAYAGLADAYTELSFFSFSPSEAMPKAREAANKALELDDRLGEAHNSLAIIKMYFDWDYAGAEQEFKHAIALNPGSAPIPMWYGWYLGLMGRFDESLKEMQGAQELDPLSATINSGIGIVFHWSRQPERAIEQFRKVLELNPNYPIACSFLAEAYAQKGEFVSAIATIEKIPQAAADPLTLSTMGYVYAKSGNREKALEILNEFVKRSNQEYVPALNFAQIYAGLGDNEQALAWLEKACDERAVWIPFLKADLKFDPLRSDPRFQELLKKVGFPAV